MLLLSNMLQAYMLEAYMLVCMFAIFLGGISINRAYAPVSYMYETDNVIISHGFTQISRIFLCRWRDTFSSDPAPCVLFSPSTQVLKGLLVLLWNLEYNSIDMALRPKGAGHVYVYIIEDEPRKCACLTRVE